MNSLLLYVISLWLLVVVGIRRQWNHIGTLLLVMYGAIAIFSLLAPKYGNLLYVEKLDPNTISYSTVIFLLISYCIYFSPFFKNKDYFSIKKMDIALNDNYNKFAVIYIVLCVITIILYIKPMISLLQSGQWALNRKIMTSDEVIYPYNNFIEKLIINCTNYFKVLALIVGFLLINKKESKTIGYLVIASVSITEVMTDLYVSARGSIAVFAMFFIALLLFFFPDINMKNTLRFVIIGLVGLLFIWPIIQAITVSRFDNSASDSVYYYLGQPIYGISKEIKNLNHHMHGRFAFGTLFGDEKFPDELSSWVHNFYTFVGWLYADWGYIGTIIVGILISIVFSMIMKKKKYSMSDLFLIFSYLKLLTDGIFTIGRTRSNMIVITIVIYIFLKVVIDKHKVVFLK